MQPKVCVLRMEGTNCEDETAACFRRVGASVSIVHLKKLLGERNLEEYDCLVIPGGFSAGDYVRAGAIFAARIKSGIWKDLTHFVEDGKLVLGICNGFQVLVELGLLPGWEPSDHPVMALSINKSAKFECIPTLLKHENKCAFTSKIPLGKILCIPSAHGEGRVTFPGDDEEEYLERLLDNHQIVFRYVDPEGNYAGYPWNPNGSVYNIAAICNPDGNILGMMPHPERVFFPWTHPDWTRERRRRGDGRAIFESAIHHIKSRSSARSNV